MIIMLNIFSINCSNKQSNNANGNEEQTRMDRTTTTPYVTTSSRPSLTPG